jgi:hypothetical protein
MRGEVIAVTAMRLKPNTPRKQVADKHARKTPIKTGGGGNTGFPLRQGIGSLAASAMIPLPLQHPQTSYRPQQCCGKLLEPWTNSPIRPRPSAL